MENVLLVLSGGLGGARGSWFVGGGGGGVVCHVKLQGVVSVARKSLVVRGVGEVGCFLFVFGGQLLGGERRAEMGVCAVAG